MNIVTVTTINRGAFKDKLTYFSQENIDVGAIVVVPLRNKQVDALVLESQPAADLKGELKSSDFSLKKVTKIKTANLLLPEFLAASQKTADFFALSLGQVLKTTLPTTILENLGQKRPPLTEKTDAQPSTTGGAVRQNKFILQDNSPERLSYYKSLIRESFAKKQSVMICLPTIRDVEQYSSAFGPGIRDYTITLHNELPKKALLQAWNKAVTEAHPLLIIATPGFLSLPRQDLKNIILEKENSEHYKTAYRPFIDFRVLANYLADELEARLYLGDLVLRAETIFKAERGDYGQWSGSKYRSPSTAEQLIFDSKNLESGDKNIYALGDDLKELLRVAVANREKIIILSGQRGLYPNTICNDCGQVVACQNCHSPLVLHKNSKEKKYFYLCHKCGATYDPHDKCPNCGSWRLALLGGGIEKVEEELRAILPDVPISVISGDRVKPTKRQEQISKFYNTKGTAILLGTEAILPFLNDKVPNIVVVAFDAMFSAPDFRLSEKILNTLLTLRQFAGKRFAIQTRNPQEKVFHYATAGNLIDFYRDEIEERMRFGYPPFKILVKITREGRLDEVKKDMEFVSELLADYAPITYPSIFSVGRENVRWQALIKLPTQTGIKPDLLDKLKNLPPVFWIDVGPESII